MKYYFLFILMLGLNACNNTNNSSQPEEEAEPSAKNEKVVRPKDPYTKSRTGLNEAEVERRLALTRAIDSSYIVIDLLQLNKDSILSEPVSGLSRESMNLRNRVIRELNATQRTISMQVDQQILTNLQANCNQLKTATTAMSADVGRLKKYGEGLNRTAKIVEGFTNFLSLCVMQGWVKPPTPADEDSKKVLAKVLAP